MPMTAGYLALRDAALAAGTLLSVHLDLTTRCPLRCLHCYLHEHQHPGPTRAELGTLLADAQSLGVLFLQLSGGEPLLHPELFWLLGQARRAGFAVKLSTAATRIDRACARELAAARVLEVGVSLYSTDPAVHDRVTGVPGSCAATLAGLEALHAAGVRLLLKTMVLPHNAGSWQGVIELAHRLDARLALDATIFPTDDGDCDHARRLTVPDDELRAVARAQLEWNRGGADAPLAAPPRPDPAAAAALPLCSGGRTSLHLAADGRVQPCAFWPRTLGDLRQERLTTIWARLRADRPFDSLSRGAMVGCADCPDRAACSPCPGLQLQLAGDPLRPAPSLCARTRAWQAARAALLVDAAAAGVALVSGAPCPAE